MLSFTSLAPAQSQLLEAPGPCKVLVLLDERGVVIHVHLRATPQPSGPKILAVRDEARQLLESSQPRGGSSWRSNTGGARTCWAAPEVMYVMYTSGSTGKPKGCVVPASGVWHRLNWGRLDAQALHCLLYLFAAYFPRQFVTETLSRPIKAARC